MEKSRLSPELQAMVDQFTKFRNEYLALKTHYAAQDELIKLQKMELEKMNLQVEKLASALVDYQKRFNLTVHHMETENRKLQEVIDNTRHEHEISRDNYNEFAREIQRNNDDYTHRLEADLEVLRAEVISQEQKHQEQIKSIEERYNNEISVYAKKIDHINLLEKSYKDQIEAYKKKLEHFDSLDKGCPAVFSDNAKNCADFTQTGLKAINDYHEYSHPAFGNCAQNIGNKRKKNAAASYRWPQLNISVNKEKEIARKTVQKKKKLYLADDDDIVVDLTS